MKKLISFILIGLLINGILCAQYSADKKIYDPTDYVYQPDDPYNPSLVRLASYKFAGWGHAIIGEFGRGVPFMAGYLVFAGVGSYGMGILLMQLLFSPYGNEKADYGKSLPFLLVGLGGAVGISLWSASDAEKIAKVKNLAWRDKQKTSLNLSIEPYCGTSLKDMDKSYLAPGLSFKINF
jgi:hypothetical protein